jgi:hypothetical protein
MTTTPPQRQERATDHSARLAAGPQRAAQRAGSRRDRPNRARRTLSSPVIALTAPLGSSAADLTSPLAKPARTVKPSPTGPSAAGRAAVALTGRARVANHATNPALPSNHYPMTTPGTGCELHAQISEKDSDTRQLIAGYDSRWTIETYHQEAKAHGVGEARNRVQNAVERTVPFGFLTQTITIAWYQLHGNPDSDLIARRRTAPWYRQKTTISYADMLAALRRELIRTEFHA